MQELKERGIYTLPSERGEFVAHAVFKEDTMKTTVNKIVPHENRAMEVHVEFRDDRDTTAPVVNVVVFIEKQDHPLSQIRSLPIDTAFEFLAQIQRSEAKAHGL